MQIKSGKEKLHGSDLQYFKKLVSEADYSSLYDSRLNPKFVLIGLSDTFPFFYAPLVNMLLNKNRNRMFFDVI